MAQCLEMQCMDRHNTADVRTCHSQCDWGCLHASEYDRLSLQSFGLTQRRWNCFWPPKWFYQNTLVKETHDMMAQIQAATWKTAQILRCNLRHWETLADNDWVLHHNQQTRSVVEKLLVDSVQATNQFGVILATKTTMLFLYYRIRLHPISFEGANLYSIIILLYIGFVLSE